MKYLLLVLCTSLPLHAQTSTSVTTNSGEAPQRSVQALPAEPLPAVPRSGPGEVPPVTSLPVQELPPLMQSVPDVPADAPSLTLAQAEAQALAHNPRITQAQLLALAQGQAVRQQRAAYMPTVAVNATAVYADDGTRLTAGGLNNPALYQRAAVGVSLTQLLTDFGRTRNLTAWAKLRADAAANTLLATRADVVFAVDQAFYRALGAQALTRVAAQSVNARGATAKQIGALANARLRSTLDLNFANANLAQAQLALLDARNASANAQAVLSALLGDGASTQYRLIDETSAAPTAPPQTGAEILLQAFASRPDLAALQQQAQAAHKFARAEHDLSLPTVTALGAAGGAPARASQITDAQYGAVGVNINIPVFNGFLYTARANEADLRARAADAGVVQLHNDIVRDVTATVLQAQSNFNRIAVAGQLLQQASSALDLAQTRYQLGLSSIVELSQAQLLQAQAEAELASARYTYQGSLSALRYQGGR